MAKYNQVNISSGHSVNCKGAVGIIDEVEEARRVVDRVAEILRANGKEVYTYHDTSYDAKQNLVNICNWHNKYKDGVDVSIHFNCCEGTKQAGIGTETLYISQKELATEVSNAIANASGLINRGAKERTGLYFLNHTRKPAILIEVCFVNSYTDVELYRHCFDNICKAIAKALTNCGETVPSSTPASTSSSGNNSSYNPHVKDWQSAYCKVYGKIGVDGIIGNETRNAMRKAVIKKGSRNYLVGYVQARVGASIDDIFGPDTERHVINFQRNSNLDPDGIVGYNTWNRLFELFR